MKTRLRWALAALFFCLGTPSLKAKEAEDFTPGIATDGGRYDLSVLHGKAVVLFFYEHTCPTCKGEVPERNKLVESYKGQPVVFIAVDPGHNLAEANAYVQETKLAMPVFADPLRVLEARWGEHISLKNIRQFKVIDPDGQAVGFSEDDIKSAVAKAHWKYKDKGYDPKLNQAIEALEWNQYAAGLRFLKPLLRDSHASVAADAKKLSGEVHAEGEQWKADAEAAVESDPVKAYDLYTKVASIFAGEELGKSVDVPLKKLKTNPAVKQELAARQMFDQLAAAMSKATSKQRADVVQFCRAIASKYPEAPTGKRASALAEELSKPS